MPPVAPTSSFSASAPHRVTGVIAVHEAGSIAVCRAGDRVALHIATPRGEVLVRMAERDFIFGCRGRADHHGNPFRSFDELDAAKRAEREAAALPPPEPKVCRPPADPARSARYGASTANFEAVQAAKDAGSPLGYHALCREHGCNLGSFYGWRHAQGHTRARNLTQLAAAGAPLPRPSALV